MSAIVSTLRAIKGFVPLLLIALLVPGRGELGTYVTLLCLTVCLSLAEGIGSWYRSRYWIEEGELRVVRGFIMRKRLFIPRARIHAVHITAGPLQRLFGVVRVEVKTAAAGTEVDLSAVSREESALLQRELDPGAAGKSQTPSRFSVTGRALLIAAATSGQLGLVLGAVVWMYDKLEQAIGEDLIQRILPHLASARTLAPLTMVAMVLLALAASWLVSTASHLLRFGRFSVARIDDRLVVTRGILELRETAIRIDRVQAIRFVESLPRLVLGYGVVYVDSAGHAEEKGRAVMLHPLLPHAEWQAFIAALAPDYTILAPEVRPPRRALRRFVLRPAWRVLLLTLAGWLVLPAGLWLLSLLPAAMLVGLLAYRFASTATAGNTLTLRYGALQRNTVVLRRRSVQSAGLDVSLLQRHNRLATLRVTIASGSGGRTFSVPDLDDAQARALLDWSRPVAMSRAIGAPVRDSTLAAVESGITPR